MMTQRQNTRQALQLDAEEATKWWQLGFEDDSQAQHDVKQILQSNNTVNCTGSMDPTYVKCDKGVSGSAIHGRRAST